jgi:excisionase family DNA binding protein
METLVSSPHLLPLRTGDNRLMTKLSDYVKIAEAARILGVSQNTLRSWAEARKIPVRRNPANGYRLFKRGDLENYLAKVEASRQRQPGRR